MKQQKHVFTSDMLSNIQSSNLTAKENLFKPKIGQQEKIQEDKDLHDKSEVNELKSRMKILMNKIQTYKKEKETLQKENQNLQQEIIQMQSNQRCMVTGFANTSSNFPMINELLNMIAEFTKCECFDIFFDVLCPELNLKGIIFFFKTSLEQTQKNIVDYFQPSFNILKQTGQFETLDGPIMNVLRKSFQQTQKQIEEKLLNTLPQIQDQIQKHLKLDDSQNLLTPFLEKLLSIMLCCFISDPPLQLQISQIGTLVAFNQQKHDPIDGFIKNKEECIILLPQVFKNDEQVGKALVISNNYEFN